MKTTLATNSPIPGSKSSPREVLLWRAFRATLAAAAWSAAIFALIALYQDSGNRIGYDFYQFWVGGDVLRQHQAAGRRQTVDLYSDAAFHDVGLQYQAMSATQSRRQREASPARRGLYTASTPFLYWVFSVTTTGDYDRAFDAYRIISLACLVASISAVGWRLHYSIGGIGAAVALAGLSAPVYSDFFVMNINCPQLAACLAYLFLRDRARRRSSFAWLSRGAAGLVMGMLVAFKPNLLLVPLLLGFRGIVSGRRRAVGFEAAGLAIGLAAAVAVSSWRFGGLSCWWDWARVIRELGTRLNMPSGYGNISLSRTLYEITGRNFFDALAMFFMALAICAIWLGRRRGVVNTEFPWRDIEFWHDLTLFGIAQTMTFMISGLAWLHYPILIFPFLMLVASRAVSRQSASHRDTLRYVLAAVVILLLMYPPARQLQSFLPIRMEGTPMSWVRCTQIAVMVTFGIGLWFESRLLRDR